MKDVNAWMDFRDGRLWLEVPGWREHFLGTQLEASSGLLDSFQSTNSHIPESFRSSARCREITRYCMQTLSTSLVQLVVWEGGSQLSGKVKRHLFALKEREPSAKRGLYCVCRCVHIYWGSGQQWLAHGRRMGRAQSCAIEGEVIWFWL